MDSGATAVDPTPDAAATAGACDGTQVCSADYPCQDLPAPSLDYTCRGQFADWTPSDSPSTFTDNGDGTVSDSNTGLLWQQAVDEGAYSWEEAKAYCENLSLDGTGWRLPTKAELESIVDFGRDEPAIDPVAFPNTPAESFFSSSPYVGIPGSLWYVGFGDGSEASAGGGALRVRCVRSSAAVMASDGVGGAPPSRYTVTNGTVYDTLTQLTWQQAVPAAPVAAGCSGTGCTQAGAIAYCAALPLDGGGWRLPQVSELLTLVDPTQFNPAIDPTAFPSTPAEDCWSSSAYVGAAGDAWAVYFYVGNSYAYYNTGSTRRVRCVR